MSDDLDSQLSAEDYNAVDTALDAALDADITAPEANPPVEPTKEPAQAAPVAPNDGKPPVAPVVPVEPAKTPTAPGEAKDAKVDAIASPKGISPKSNEGWNALKSVAKERGVENATLAQEKAQLHAQLEELRKSPVDPKVQEELNTAKKELSKYKALYLSEKDPEFQDKFDKQIQTNEESVYKILEDNGMARESIEEIKSVGLDKVPDSFWQKDILPNLTLVEKAKLEKAITQRSQLKDERRASLEGVGQNWEKFESEQKEKTNAQYTDYTEQMGQHITALTKDIPWAKFQEIPANATPEQKAAIQKSNDFFKESSVRFDAALYPATPQARVEVAAAACLSYKLQGELEEADKSIAAKEGEITRLTEELETIKGASVLSRKVIAPKTDGKQTVDISNMKDSDAVDAGLDAVGA